MPTGAHQGISNPSDNHIGKSRVRFGAQEEASRGQRPQASLSYPAHERISPSQNTCWELLVWGIRLTDGTELPEPVSLQRDRMLLILLQDVVQLPLPSEVPRSSSASTSLSIIRIIKIYSRSPQELKRLYVSVVLSS